MFHYLVTVLHRGSDTGEWLAGTTMYLQNEQAVSPDYLESGSSVACKSNYWRKARHPAESRGANFLVSFKRITPGCKLFSRTCSHDMTLALLSSHNTNFHYFQIIL